ncbi:MAG: c-type cytochrome [Acidimicrobiia bacterium]|nr:c-type cytochrome [Acidimicrobiia bacterium]
MARRTRVLLVLLTAPALVALAGCSDGGGGGGDRSGEEVFSASCASCHGPDGGGGLGPDLEGVAERLTREEHRDHRAARARADAFVRWRPLRRRGRRGDRVRARPRRRRRGWRRRRRAHTWGRRRRDVHDLGRLPGVGTHVVHHRHHDGPHELDRLLLIGRARRRGAVAPPR